MKQKKLVAFLLALLFFTTASYAAPVAVTSGSILLGINNVKVETLGTFDLRFSPTFNYKYETNEFSKAASDVLGSFFMSGGFLQGTDVDYTPGNTFGCTGFICSMNTPTSFWWHEGRKVVQGFAAHNYFEARDGDDRAGSGGAKINSDGSTPFSVTNTFVQWSHSVAPSAVPIPAAAFLFAPALLGFIGLRRKFRS